MTTTATRGLVALVLLAAGACTPRVHRLAPYSDDARAAAAVEHRAVEYCRAAHGDTRMPPRPFTTDGCSMWFDGDWADCCLVHDMAYWCGGSADERRAADRALEACVDGVASDAWGAVMYAGVRAGGAPWTPFPWRWGYGWPCCRGYDDPPPAR